MKETTLYFRHDCNARQDEKVLALRMKHKWEGYGIYWALIERLRQAEGYACVKDYNLIAYDLRTEAALVKSIIEDFGLFEFTDSQGRGECFYSKRLCNDMATKGNLSGTRSAAGKKGMAKRYQVEDPEITELQQSNNSVITKKDFVITKKDFVITKKIFDITKKDFVITKLQQSDNQGDNQKDNQGDNQKDNPPITKEKETKKEKEKSPLIPPYKEKEINKEKENGGNAKRFSPPSHAEVEAYVREKGYTFSADTFVAYYESNGWRVGKNPMKNWKAACRTWQSKENQNPVKHNRYVTTTSTAEPSTHDFHQQRDAEVVGFLVDAINGL